MATFTFDGTASQTTAFNATVDRVVFNLNARDLASVSEDRANNTITFVATSGAVLTLTGTNFAALRADGTSLVAGFESNIVFGIGTAGVDTETGNVLVGLDGGDTLNAFNGAEGQNFNGALVFGNQGDDFIFADGMNVRLYGGQGDDTIELGNASAASASLIVAGLGEDTVRVGGTDVAGGDEYNGSITIFGGNEAGDPTDGADLITVALSDTGTATIFGNGGDDEITVTGTGTASVYGGQGDDTITAEVSSGLFVGGLGGDTIDVTLTETDSSATIFGGNGAGDAVDGDDTISVTAGDGASATIYGNGGDDTITLVGAEGDSGDFGAGSFQVFGGQGNDIVTGDIGDGTVIYGGLGIDQVNVEVVGTGAAVTVFGGNGDADAADSADVITVDLIGPSTTSPVPGVTVPVAGQTAVIYGNGGDDIITVTGEGSATVFGGSGDDTINAGEGQYVLTGGVGEDEFNFALAGNTTEDNLSVITDFTFGEDTIVFDSLVTENTIGRATLTSADEFSDIVNANSSTTQAALITVSSGEFAGNYAVFSGQVIDITGFTGTPDAGSFGFTAPTA